jgi:hypothetical protein
MSLKDIAANEHFRTFAVALVKIAESTLNEKIPIKKTIKKSRSLDVAHFCNIPGFAGRNCAFA